MRNFSRAILLLVPLGLAACATAQEPQITMADKAAIKDAQLVSAGWVRLDSSTLRTEIVDHTLSGSNAKGTEWQMYTSPDGTLRASARGADWGPESQTGTYTISEDGLWCRTWTDWSDGKEGCSHFYIKDNTIAGVAVSGTHSNPEGIEATRVRGDVVAL